MRGGDAEVNLVAESRDRDQQDHRGDGDENIVEAGQQAKMFLIHRTGAQPGDMVAQRLGAGGRQRAGRYGILQIALAIHSGALLVGPGSGS